jgi:hypothetical protein
VVRTVEFATVALISWFFVIFDPCSELGTRMTLLSPYQDLVFRSLADLAGPLARLIYLGSLRDDAGNYCHWGMSRSFGHQQASEALAQAHTEVWLEVLRTPISALFDESRRLAADAEVAIRNELRSGKLEKLTPANPGGGTKRHFSSILLALSRLSQATKEPNQRAA